MGEPLQAISGDMTATLDGDAMTVQLYKTTTIYPLNQIYSVEYTRPSWLGFGQLTLVRSIGPLTMNLASGNRKKFGQVWDEFFEALATAVERAVPKVETPAAGTKSKSISIFDAQYLGGIVGVGAGIKGTLMITESQIGIGHNLVELDSIFFVEVDGGQVAKNRAIPVVLFGVAGLAAKGTKDRAFINVILKSGAVVVYQVDNLPPQQVVATIAGFLSKSGVPLGAPSNLAANTTHSVAEEIAKFADLRDRGILTEGEFAAKKAQLLG